MDLVADPFLNLYNDGPVPSIAESLLFTNDDNLGSIDLDLPLNSPNKVEQETLSALASNPGKRSICWRLNAMISSFALLEFEAELNNFLANFPSPDSSMPSKNNSGTIDLLDDFPFSPFDDEQLNRDKPQVFVETPQPTPSAVAAPKLPVIINTSKMSNQHLPKVVQLTKGNVVYIQAPNNSNKSQTNFIQLANCLPTILINTPISSNSAATHQHHEEHSTMAASNASLEDFPMDESECRNVRREQADRTADCFF